MRKHYSIWRSLPEEESKNSQRHRRHRHLPRGSLFKMTETSTNKVKVKCFNGSAFTLDYDPSDHVTKLQEKIAQESGIEIERQTLLYKGQLLEGEKEVGGYGLKEGGVISVAVRRGGGKAKSKVVKKEAGKKEEVKKEEVKKEESTKVEDLGVNEDGMGDVMRGLGLGAGAGGMAGMAGMGGMGGAGGAQQEWMAGLQQMLAAGGGAGAGVGVGDGQEGMQQVMNMLPQLMSGLWNSPEMKEYLKNPEEQERSREALIKNMEENPFVSEMMKRDPEFKKMIEDPDKWKESMSAAKNLFETNMPIGANGAPTAANAAKSTGGDEAKSEDKTVQDVRKGEKANQRQTAADVAPLGIDIRMLSEAYGHALGQSLVNSGLGLDPDLVIKGLKSCCNGKDFPMPLHTYEKQMSKLQEIANKFVAESNLEDAKNFFAEIEKESQFKIVEKGKVAYQPGELAPDQSKPAANKDSTVLVIVRGRLLDDRFFFTCPAADDSGETVHPLTLPLSTAPPALRDGIVGMRESEERTLFVHPSAAEQMADMFGDLLPINALLIFDLELVKAQAPPEEIEAAKKAEEAAAALRQSAKA